MPFGFFQNDDHKAAQAERDAAVDALNRGEITPGAKRRLEAQRGSAASTFSSTLAPSDLLLARQSGWRPLTQVMGSAFVQLDLESYKEECIATREIMPLTYRHCLVRQLALMRLMQEARLAGADGVVGVKLVKRDFAWGGGISEFTATGTAIAVPDKPVILPPDKGDKGGNAFFKKAPAQGVISRAGQGQIVGAASYLVGYSADQPFLSNLSGSEFWQLYQAGYWPRALVSSNYTYFVLNDDQSRKAQSGLLASMQNQELTCFSNGINFARLRAMERLQKEVKDSGGHGVVGIEMDPEIEGVSFKGEPHFVRGIIASFSVLGTSVFELGPEQLRSASGGAGDGKAMGARKSPVLIIDLKSLASSIISDK